VAGAHRARVEDVLAHAGEHRPGALEQRRISAHHDRERALGGPAHAARDSRVDEERAAQGEHRGQLGGVKTISRRHLEQETAGP
jgi:hypothetical protein